MNKRKRDEEESSEANNKLKKPSTTNKEETSNKSGEKKEGTPRKSGEKKEGTPSKSSEKKEGTPSKSGEKKESTPTKSGEKKEETNNSDPKKEMSKNTLMAHLVCSNAAKAIEFYQSVFGAKLLFKQLAKDSKSKITEFKIADNDERILHASLSLNGSNIMLNDDFEEGGKKNDPLTLKGCPVTLTLCMDKPTLVDDITNKARDAGAKIISEPSDMFWGDRYSRFSDPQGFMWAVAAPLTPPKI